jgi:hypothetical protein
MKIVYMIENTTRKHRLILIKQTKCPISNLDEWMVSAKPLSKMIIGPFPCDMYFQYKGVQSKIKIEKVDHGAQ